MQYVCSDPERVEIAEEESMLLHWTFTISSVNYDETGRQFGRRTILSLKSLTKYETQTFLMNAEKVEQGMVHTGQYRSTYAINGKA